MKCKQCSKKVDKEKLITQWVYYFCSKQHRLDFNREKVRKEKEKVKVRKQKLRIKKANSVSVLTKKADALWSECVKIRDNFTCRYCWKTTHLNSHHLFTRARKSTRWSIDNWITLCSGCHTLSSKFSAHQTPFEFFEWLEKQEGREYIDELSLQSREVADINSELLQEQIDYLTKYKDNSTKK